MTPFALSQAIGFIAGGIAGVAFEIATSVATGQDLTLGGVSGAFGGGAVTGLVFASTGNIAAAGAAGAGVDSVLRQGIDNGVGNINVAEVATETAVGAVAGAVGQKAVKTFKVPGVTSGRGSIMHVVRTQTTRALIGSTSSVTLKTASKIGAGAAIAGGVEGLASGTVGTGAAKFARQTAPDATLIQGAACSLGTRECNN